MAIGLAKLLRKPIVMTVRPPTLPHPVRLRARTSDLLVYEQVLINKQYECPLSREPTVIVDAGANIGLSTVYFAARYPQAQILAIEPEPQNFKLLQKNTSTYKNVKAIMAALWWKNTRVNVKITEADSEPWAFHVEESANGAVPAVTLPTLLRHNGIGHVDILKIDVEGAEREIFEKKPDWIHRVDLLAIELHDRLKRGCSRAVYDAMRHHSAWSRDEITFFKTNSSFQSYATEPE